MSLPGRFLQIGQHRIFHHRGGHGRPLVLVPGFLMSHWQFRAIVPALAEEHEVIAFDLPGCGESDRPAPADYRYDAGAFTDTLIGVLDSLGIERASLLGHSLGGGIALLAAARRPERIESLIVVDPLCYPWNMPAPARLALTPWLGARLLGALSNRALCRAFMRRQIYRDPACVTEDLVDYVWERLNRPGGVEAAVATLRLVADPRPIAHSLRAVRAPTMVVWGQEDRLFPSSWARRLATEIPGSAEQVIADCGHSPPEERPRELLAGVLPFLRARAAKRRVA